MKRTVWWGGIELLAGSMLPWSWPCTSLDSPDSLEATVSITTIPWRPCFPTSAIRQRQCASASRQYSLHFFSSRLSKGVYLELQWVGINSGHVISGLTLPMVSFLTNVAFGFGISSVTISRVVSPLSPLSSVCTELRPLCACAQPSHSTFCTASDVTYFRNKDSSVKTPCWI